MKMFASIRRKLKWNPIAAIDSSKENKKSYLILLFAGLFEEILFWRTKWLSVSFIIICHVIILVCVLREISLFQFILCFTLLILIMDAFENWLKYKHRTTFLKRISNIESTKLNSIWIKFTQWMKRCWNDFVFMRETNPTKAYLIVNFVLGSIFFLGRYISGYLLVYLLVMFICFAYKVVPPIVNLFSHVWQDIESDTELEGLMPEASDIDINLLNIEPDPLIDERQSLDYWKPDDETLEEASDSSENSSSLATNFSMEKVEKLQKDETSDSSEDEYIPLVKQKEQLHSTLEVAEPSSTWSDSAYNVFWNITGAITNMVNSDKARNRKRIKSADSSDGFEIIDKNELN